eukprot:TRINITY_DN51720_c0_g1_i1.p2 TRINITY_DN51720_c0_g1~~TRINITY_DN51720_c0_g1_i1.p2  ORF type:complete len:110 (-),score=25.37 TRINITY_DN51720_c0_g1_i1:11-340(-)
MPLDWHIIGVQSIKNEEKWRKIWRQEEKQQMFAAQKAAELEALEGSSMGSSPGHRHGGSNSSSRRVLSQAGSLTLDRQEADFAGRSAGSLKKSASTASLTALRNKPWMP